MNEQPTISGRTVRRVHLLGASGMGMMPLGLYLAELGFVVSAEDDHWNPAARELLEKAGIKLGSVEALSADAGLAVYSSALGESHPARRRLAGAGVPTLRRGEMLAELARWKKLVAIVGSHGKTTTTAMLVAALQQANFKCSWILGGLFEGNLIPPARVTKSDWLVAEIDESDGTIGGFSPEITLAVNLDWDHADRYTTREAIETEFAAFFSRTHRLIFVNDACPVSTRLVQKCAIAGKVRTFGRTGDFEFQIAVEVSPLQTLRLSGSFTLGEVSVRALGAFNAANAAAALAVAQTLGARLARKALTYFPGVQRRQTYLYASPDITVVEDYAHHPTEVRALLSSFEVGAKRLVAVFQPHRYTRTVQFKAELAAALAPADLLFLLDVYSAGEPPVTGGTTTDIYIELKKSGYGQPITYLPGDRSGTARALSGTLQPGDTLVFVGAGDIGEFAHDFAATLQRAAQRDAIWRQFVGDLQMRLSVTTKLTMREPLAPKTTIRIGGPARAYAEPASETDLQVLLREAYAHELSVFILGRGSNLLVPDEGVDGLVICLAHPSWQAFELQPDGRLWAGAGLRLKNLCGLAAKAGFSGFEFLEGIPGSLGGALRMNAGAMGSWTFDVVDEVHLLTFTGEKQVKKNAEMRVVYRCCFELENAIATGAFLRPAAQVASDEVKRKIEVYQKWRMGSQPREPSAGCIFKNPATMSAGRLIDELGLKGERVGDAEVSSVHGNFIVNRGHATSADIMVFIQKIRKRAKAACGIELEPEILLFGKEWKELL